MHRMLFWSACDIPEITLARPWTQREIVSIQKLLLESVRSAVPWRVYWIAYIVMRARVRLIVFCLKLYIFQWINWVGHERVRSERTKCTFVSKIITHRVNFLFILKQQGVHTIISYLIIRGSWCWVVTAPMCASDLRELKAGMHPPHLHRLQHAVRNLWQSVLLGTGFLSISFNDSTHGNWPGDYV